MDNLHLWKKIVIGFIAGVIAGFALKQNTVYLKPLGALFINALRMVSMPIIFFSVMNAIINTKELKKFANIGFKALSIYLICMLLASGVGLSLANIISPGTKLYLMNISNDIHQAQIMPGWMNMIANLVPANPIKAFLDQNILQILVFSILLGIAIRLSREQALLVVDFFKAGSAVVFKLVNLVMKIAPYAIFASVASIIGETGFSVLIPLMKFVGVFYLSCLLFVVVIYLGTLTVIRISPLVFIKKIYPALMFAYSSSSSAATLPLTLKCAEENLGISKEISQFLLPLGLSLNLNGLSIFISVAVIFTANLYGFHLGVYQYLSVMIMIAISCMGVGGIPGAGIIIISAVLHSIGLPLGAILLLASVDRFNDMLSTAVNVMGDLFTGFIIAKSENQINLATYRQSTDMVFNVSEISESGEENS